ncbi:MAG: DNA-binding response regulator [Bacteroidetes bacterium]|nr:MAG: DNA-binding response regulator [Bacteroidota bacterium]
MKNKFTYIAVEDEPLQLTNLIETLDHRLDLQLLVSFESAREAFDYLSDPKKERPDLMFLDMQLPEINGLQLLEAIKHFSPKPKVIITTAFEDYAIPSYEFDVSGYVVKPIDSAKLNKAIDKAIADLKNERKKHPGEAPFASDNDPADLFVKVENRMVRVLPDEIIYLEGANVNVKIVTTSESLLTRNTLKKMEALLPDEHFMRIHDSFIINLKFLKSYAANYAHVHLDDRKMPIPVGKKYRNKFKNRMLDHLL